jgi:ATP-dependent Clp protease protease subunit
MEPVKANGPEEKERGASVRLAERLLKSRTVLISSGIDEETVEEVIRDLVLMEQDSKTEPITVYINTPGGAADCGFAIYDVLRFMRPPVTAIVTGLCASAGVIVFLGAPAGRRLALPNSRFMLHEPRFLSAAYGEASDLAITAKELLKMKDRYNTIVAEASGKSLEQVSKDTQRDFWLSADEAKAYGLVTRIVKSRDEV